jgi:hypothetical protein
MNYQAWTQHQGLGCGVVALEYDYLLHCGRLDMPSGHSCSMQRCIDFFMIIDPRVAKIDIFAEGARETCYMMREGSGRSLRYEARLALAC